MLQNAPIFGQKNQTKHNKRVFELKNDVFKKTDFNLTKENFPEKNNAQTEGILIHDALRILFSLVLLMHA